MSSPIDQYIYTGNLLQQAVNVAGQGLGVPIGTITSTKQPGLCDTLSGIADHLKKLLKLLSDIEEKVADSDIAVGPEATSKYTANKSPSAVQRSNELLLMVLVAIENAKRIYGSL